MMATLAPPPVLRSLETLLRRRWPRISFLDRPAGASIRVPAIPACVVAEKDPSRLVYCEAPPGVDFPSYQDRRRWGAALSIAPGDLVVFGSTCRTRFLLGGYFVCEDFPIYLEQSVPETSTCAADTLATFSLGSWRLVPGWEPCLANHGAPSAAPPIERSPRLDLDSAVELRRLRDRLARTAYLDADCTDARWLLDRARDLTLHYLQLLSRIRCELYDREIHKGAGRRKLRDLAHLVEALGADHMLPRAVSRVRRLVVQQNLFAIAPSRAEAEEVRSALRSYCGATEPSRRFMMNVRVYRDTGRCAESPPRSLSQLNSAARLEDLDVLAFARRVLVQAEVAGAASVSETRRAAAEIERRRRRLIEWSSVMWSGRDPIPPLGILSVHFPELIGCRRLILERGRGDPAAGETLSWPRDAC